MRPRRLFANPVTRLIAIAIAIAIPLFFILLDLTTNWDRNARLQKREEAGLIVAQHLEELRMRVVEHASLALNLQTDQPGAIGALHYQQQLIEDKLLELAELGKRFGDLLQLTSWYLQQRKQEEISIENIKNQWKSLQAELLSRNSAHSQAEHKKLITLLDSFVTYIATSSGLVTDTALDIYHMSSLLFRNLPTHQLNLMKLIFELEARGRNNSNYQFLAIAPLIEEITGSDNWKLIKDVDSAVGEDFYFHGESKSLKPSLVASRKIHLQHLSSLKQSLQALLGNPSDTALLAPAISTARESLRSSSSFWHTGAKQAQELLKMRASELRRQALTEAITRIAALVLSLLLLYLVSRERRAQLRTLGDMRSRADVMLETALDAIVSINHLGQVVTWNPQAELLFGWSKTDVKGAPLADLIIPPRDREAYERGLATFLKTGDGPMLGSRIEVTALNRDGREFPVELSIAPHRTSKGWHFSAFIRDISARRRAEQKLISAREAAEDTAQTKAQFLANMSHEIRTPMNGILGMTQLVLDTSLSSEQRDLLLNVQSASEDLLRIINDILDFSKIEAGKLEFHDLPIQLPTVVNRCVSLLSLRAEESGVTLSSRFDPDVPEWITADDVRLGQVVMNLLGNAIKFTPPGGGVFLHLSSEMLNAGRCMVHFRVTDAAIGINPEKLESIFSPFEQGDTSLARRFGGTGLGLSIARALVEAMNGRIWVESREGLGSIFHFTLVFHLPNEIEITKYQAERKNLALPEATPQKISPISLRVLIAEDNLVNQKLILKLLEKRGCKTLAVGNGADALRIMLEEHGYEKFDLILMDCNMPVMSGFEATHKLREHEHTAGVKIPIVAMTALAMKGDREKCLELGMDDYISKPINVKELDRVLDSRRKELQKQVEKNSASPASHPKAVDSPNLP